MGLTAGALSSLARVDALADPFPALIDTGSPLTAYDDGSGQTRGRVGSFHLFSQDTPSVERLGLDQVQLFVTPLDGIGLGGTAAPIGGLLGGDLLRRFALGLDYRGTAPQIQLTSGVIRCSCELAAACQAVFPFTLQGGQQVIALEGQLYPYPASRVVIDACLEPLADPLQAELPCGTDRLEDPVDPAYLPSGVEVRLLVATGFPGFALGAKAYDRLRGAGAAAAARALAPAELSLPSAAAPIPVARASLGGAATSALALVSRELYFGPCAELARSRRQRRSPPGRPRPGERACLRSRATHPGDERIAACAGQATPADVCDDDSEAARTAAVVELRRPLEALVVADAEPLLRGPNSDVRPMGVTIEGVIGTELLARLVSTIDYPGSRLIARCVTDGDCLTYPRFVAASQQGECDALCRPPSSIADAPRPGGACDPAP